MYFLQAGRHIGLVAESLHLNMSNWFANYFDSWLKEIHATLCNLNSQCLHDKLRM